VLRSENNAATQEQALECRTRYWKNFDNWAGAYPQDAVVSENLKIAMKPNP
jgi:hypothetical protein